MYDQTVLGYGAVKSYDHRVELSWAVEPGLYCELRGSPLLSSQLCLSDFMEGGHIVPMTS